MECLRDSGYESSACRQRAMAYLECRMERQVVPAPLRPSGHSTARPSIGGLRGSGVAPGAGKQRGCLRGKVKGTRSGGVHAGSLCPCKKQVSFVASAVHLAYVFDVAPRAG